MLDALPTSHSVRAQAAPADRPADPAAATPLPLLLHALTEAYAAGDAPRGEQLLLEALDGQIPWDVVCAAAARGISARYGGQPRA